MDGNFLESELALLASNLRLAQARCDGLRAPGSTPPSPLTAKLGAERLLGSTPIPIPTLYRPWARGGTGTGLWRRRGQRLCNKCQILYELLTQRAYPKAKRFKVIAPRVLAV
eukprot:694066-Prymnesium_polylepis.1